MNLTPEFAVHLSPAKKHPASEGGLYNGPHITRSIHACCMFGLVTEYSLPGRVRRFQNWFADWGHLSGTHYRTSLTMSALSNCFRRHCSVHSCEWSCLLLWLCIDDHGSFGNLSIGFGPTQTSLRSVLRP